MWRSSGRLLTLKSTKSLPGRVNAPRNFSGQNVDSRSATTIASVGAATGLTLVGGSIILAKSSEGYRNFSEKYIPGTSWVYKVVLGPKPEKISIPEKKPDEGLMKKKLERESIKKKDNLLIITTGGDSSTIAPPLAPPKPTQAILPSTSEPVVVKQEEQAAVVTTPLECPMNELGSAAPKPPTEATTSIQEEVKNLPEPPYVQANDILAPVESIEEKIVVVPLEVENPADFPVLLADLQSKAAEAVSQAVFAQDEAAIAIKKHVDMVYRALETVYDPNQSPEHVWEPVYQATQEKTGAIHRAEETARNARLAVALLKETIAHGIKNNQSIASPDLITFDESVARSLYSLETAKARFEAAQSEATVMDEYRNLVDTARRHLQLEMSSIRPELAPSRKADETKLGEEELNILMAHAYWKIITLQKELARQQVLEQQRLRSALEVQRKEDTVVMESRIRAELEKQYYELKAQFSHDMDMHEKALSEEFTKQMKRQAAAHIDHLNEVLATQQEELTRKHQIQLELESAQHQLARNHDLAKLTGMVKGIQESVQARAGKDHVARQVRELWLATQSLIDDLRSNESTYSGKWQEQRRSLEKPLELLSSISNSISHGKVDEFVKVVIDTVPKEATIQGILPQGALKDRFLDVERVCRRVALIGDNGGSLIKYALSYLQSFLVINTDNRRPPEQEIDIEKMDTYEILRRARYHLEKDDLENALRYMNLLRGEPLLVAQDWLEDLRLHLEAVQAAEAIQVYATITSIETI